MDIHLNQRIEQQIKKPSNPDWWWGTALAIWTIIWIVCCAVVQGVTK